MSNIRLRYADDLPLFIPAHSFRLLEEVEPGSNGNFPDQTCALIYDLGDNSGLQTALLATSPDVVVEQVRSDPRFMGRLVEFRSAGGRIWVQPQHQNGISGVRPPSEDELAELDAKLKEDEATFAALTGAPADAERARMEQLRINVGNRKSFAGLHAKLNIVIPSVLGEQHYSYFVTASAEDVEEAVNPPPPKPVGAAPVGKRARRRRA